MTNGSPRRKTKNYIIFKTSFEIICFYFARRRFSNETLWTRLVLVVFVRFLYISLKPLLVFLIQTNSDHKERRETPAESDAATTKCIQAAGPGRWFFIFFSSNVYLPAHAGILELYRETAV